MWQAMIAAGCSLQDFTKNIIIEEPTLWDSYSLLQI